MSNVAAKPPVIGLEIGTKRLFRPTVQPVIERREFIKAGRTRRDVTIELFNMLVLVVESWEQQLREDRQTLNGDTG